MTSYMTTGGIRGGKISIENYEPRSFNMGISKEAFQATGGFGRIHPEKIPICPFDLKKWVTTYILSPKHLYFINAAFH